MVQEKIQEVIRQNYIDSCKSAGVPLNPNQINLLENTLENITLTQSLDEEVLKRVCDKMGYQKSGKLVTSIVQNTKSEPTNMQALNLYENIKEITNGGQLYKRGVYFRNIPRNFSRRQYKLLEEYLKEKGLI